jgi:Glucodextranase, domain B
VLLRRPALLFVSLLLLFAAAAQAGTFNAFGPKPYSRSDATPVAQSESFHVRNASIPYVLHVLNHGLTSAVITLNGVQVVGPKDFNANTPADLQKPVTLRKDNTLTIDLRGAPGTGADLRITGEDNDLPSITATVTPPPNAAGWNNSVPVSVSFACSDATSGVVSCSDPVELSDEGPGSVVVGTAIDAAGNIATASVTLNIDTLPPTLTAKVPVDNSGRTNAASLAITGTAIDNDQVAAVTINGVPAALAGNDWSLTVPLSDGANALHMVATDRAGNQATYTFNVTRYTIPAVAITAPADLSFARDAAITVSGTVTDPAASVAVNGIAATVSGTTWSAAGIPLAQGRTVLTATATNAQGHAGTSSIIVYRDSIPPRVVLREPVDGAVVYQPSVDVAGAVDDIVVGTINSAQMRVTVNGTPAAVSNRAFVAGGVPLTPGANTITVVATDQGGNSTTVTAHITYNNSAQAKIVAVSGDGQTAAIGTALPQPLVVRLVNANGTPAANRAVAFEVAEDNGVVTSGSATARIVTATTDANGTASVVWTLGTRAGSGNNRVAARADGFAGEADFAAVATIGAPHLIVVDSGNSQFGAMSATLPRPFVAVVIDGGNNRVAGVPVTFVAETGGGSFGGQPSLTVTTDSDGRAVATATLGIAGTNVFNAKVNGVDRPASFIAYGRIAGDPSQTTISGVILDNTDLPIPGVTVRIDGTQLTAQANDQGQFTIAGAPVGYVKLFIDGSTARRAGTWPMLEYAMYTIPGANNTLDQPVHILPLDVRRGLFVDETTGGTLTLPELPGFKLTVKPGSVTFPGGSRTGTVSVTLVHADKIPMTPGFGQQPRFIVTIQPPGAHFDPPAQLTIPNVDGMQPLEVTEFYSFDHDLGQFVSIGTGTVSADGTVITSDPGVGIIKGGWHCGGSPSASGTPYNCPECQKCENGNCKPDPGKRCVSCGASGSGTACDGKGNCQGGAGFLNQTDFPDVCQSLRVTYTNPQTIIGLQGCPTSANCLVGTQYQVTTITHSCDSISLAGASLMENVAVTSNTCAPNAPLNKQQRPMSIGAGNNINTVDDYYFCMAFSTLPSTPCSVDMTQTYNIGGCSQVDQHHITISVQRTGGTSCSGSVARN